MRDLKYIVKRILIGVGIVLVLGFINNAKASALEDLGSYKGTVSRSTVENSSVLNNFYSVSPSYNGLLFYQDTDTGDFVYCKTYDNTNCEIFYISQIPNFSYNKIGMQIYTGSSTSTQEYDIILTSGDLSKFSGSSVRDSLINYSDTILIRIRARRNYNLTDDSIYVYRFEPNESYAFNVNFGDNFSFFSNVYWNYWGSRFVDSNIDIETNFVTIPIIESLQPTKISNNNIITGYIFRPKFSNFDTTNYLYQYKIGKDSNTWLSINSNEQQIKINNNVELYFRIKEQSNNNIIDNRNFTITDIGTFFTSQNYDIKFSADYRTENYLNNNIYSKSQSIIKEYQIYIDYIPKTSILKYQYQFVNEGDSLDNDNWQNVPSSDNGSTTYVATENGTLYARILNTSDTVLFSHTFTVNSIGLLAFDSNENGVNNFLTKLSNKINYGGPVSSLFLVPVNLLNSLYTPIFNSNSCSNLQLGNLLGTNLSLPCVDVKRYLGNNVYNLIDLIISFFLILGIIRLSINIYNKFISMKDISS